MKKILYIDPISPIGHINFNKLYIKELKKLNYEVDYIFREKYYKHLNIENLKPVYEIPEQLYKREGGNFFLNKILIRKDNIVIYNSIKENVDIKKYDRIFFSSFEEIAMYFSKMKENLILLNHINLVGFEESKIKRFFLKKLFKKNRIVVLEPYMKEYLKKFGEYDIEILPHPLIEKFIDNKLTLENKKYSQIIFSPSATSCDEEFIKEMIEDKNFLNYLEENKILIIIKSKIHSFENNYLKVIKNYLKEEEYRSYFIKATGILLPYEKRFKNRVSGILFEAISNEKVIYMKNVEGLIYYSKMNNKIFKTFDTIEGLKKELNKKDRI
ncbi:MAG: hypothetical protein ACRC18_12605, partial [Cetobacterium sp.]